MKALISPQEKSLFIANWDADGNPVFLEAGKRVCQVEPEEFQVAPPLFWVECAEGTVADRFYYDEVSGAVNPLPLPPEKPGVTDTIPVDPVQP